MRRERERDKYNEEGKRKGKYQEDGKRKSIMRKERERERKCGRKEKGKV